MEFLISCSDGGWLDLDDEEMYSILTDSQRQDEKASIDPEGGYRVLLPKGEALVSAEPSGWQVAFVDFKRNGRSGQSVRPSSLKGIEDEQRSKRGSSLYQVKKNLYNHKLL